MEGADKTRSVIVVEDVEQATVQDGVVALAAGPKFQRVVNQKAGGKVALFGLSLCEPDGPRG